jgi:bis(5'-nucleosyl)-tetraphosphatase (symmetrical)
MGRRIFVGDIQGCREELERLLEAVHFGPGDRLEPTGDFVNRGPDSLGTLRLLKDLDVGGVLGNHDVHALRLARGQDRRGRRDTLDALLAADDRDELLGWLAARPFVRAFDDVLLVHGGLNPRWKDPAAALRNRDPLGSEPEAQFAVMVRFCDAEGRRPVRDDPPPGPPFQPWYEHWRGRDPRQIIFGHWARHGLFRDNGFLGLDTGCVWGGHLTAWIAEDDRIEQVPAARAYQPRG